jgi:signal transduction histidine kinase
VIGMERPRHRSPWLADLLLWLLITAPLLLPADEVPPDQPAGLPLAWVKVAAVPLLGVAVLVARRQPLAAAAVPAALGLAATPELDTGVNLVVAQVVLAYLLGLRSDRRRAALCYFLGLLAVGVLLLSVSTDATVADTLTLAGSVLVVHVLPWLAGQYWRQRAELLRAGWLLAERLEQEQALVSDRARLRERSRIAHDMHDTLGHELSLIALRAAALEVAPDIGPHGQRAARALREAAADTTLRLRDVIEVLREDGESAPTRPARETVAALVERAVASGMPVTLDNGLTPPPEGTAPALPPMTDRSIYRVVQEALTNAAKHAPAAPVCVTVRLDDEHAVVSVVSQPAPGPTPPGPPRGPGGHGLVSLDERVRLAGGTLRARPAGGGFAVSARLPIAAGAGATPPSQPARAQQERDLVHRQATRHMINTVWLPAAAVVGFLLLMLGYGWYEAERSVLRTEAYEQLRLGEQRSAVEGRLPPPLVRARPTPADPPGVDGCQFYRASAGGNSRTYRLCFTDGRLSHKDTVTLGD